MNRSEYKDFYNKVGKLNGWDFSQLNIVYEGVQWDFYNEVTQRCDKSDIWLDIGTGGGEAILPISENALLVVGIDHSTGMIETAHENLRKAKKSNVRFLQMEADKVDFPESFFNVVSCRHSEFNAEEVARILSDDGVFLTQQVSEHDKYNIKHAFGRGQNYDTADGGLKNKYMSELSEAGFTDIQAFEFDAIQYFQTYEDMIFFLTNTPVIPNFGQSDGDFDVLHTFMEHNQTQKGIKTNLKRFMIIAKK